MRRALRVVSLVGVMGLVAGCIGIITPGERERYLDGSGRARSLPVYSILTDRILFDHMGAVGDYAAPPAAIRVAVKLLVSRYHAAGVEEVPLRGLVLVTFPVQALFSSITHHNTAVAIRIEPRGLDGSRVTVLVEPVNRRGDRSIVISAEKVHEELRLLVVGQVLPLTGAIR